MDDADRTGLLERLATIQQQQVSFSFPHVRGNEEKREDEENEKQIIEMIKFFFVQLILFLV